MVRNGRLDQLGANRLGRALRAGLREPRAAGQHRSLPLPRPGCGGVLTTSASTVPASSTCILHHPLVGDLELNFEAMELTGDPGLLMNIYSAEPASKSEESLHILGSWSASTARASASG